MRRLGTWAILLIPVLAVSATEVGYLSAGTSPPPMATSLGSTALGLGIILWVEADARRRRIVPCHDFGFLVGAYFPASVIWYAFWSRGRRGVLLLLGLHGLLLVPWACSMAVWAVLYARS